MAKRVAAETKRKSIVQRIVEYPEFLYNFTRWKLGFCRRLRKHPPVFVYQMGKVASRSLEESLSAQYRGEVIHSHWFYPDHGPGEARELYKYWHSQDPPDCLYIISLIRNPLDRNISAFFQNFKDMTGYEPRDYPSTLNALKETFLNKFEHHIPLVWFDELIKGNFGIDVYERPFPDRGYDTFANGNARLLLLRVEEDDATKTHAVKQYLELPHFVLNRKNVSKTKDYGDLYQSFKNEVRFPKSYVDTICHSKVFQHFYNREDEANTRARWQEDYNS